MKIIKFKQKKIYSYKRKVLIKDLVLKMLVGIHSFEKKKKQRVKFNLTNCFAKSIPSFLCLSFKEINANPFVGNEFPEEI